jgi:hypothetical protein
MLKALGYLMIATPFLGLVALTYSMGGWHALLIIFGSCAVIIGLIGGGVALVNR